MAKNKPSVAFLEALQQEKKRRGVENKAGVGFRTPEWFFNQPQGSDPSAIGYQRVARRPWMNPAYWLVALVTVCLIGGIAYYVGRSKGPTLSPSSDLVKAGPANPEAMNPQASVSAPPASSANPDNLTAVNPPPVQLEGKPVAREVGKNYVIIQSYLEKKTADEASDALKKAGIDCTVERNVPYNPKAFVVMGTTGFVRTSTPEYKAYTNKILAVSEKFANVPGSRKWRKFDPGPYMWK